MLLRTLRIIAVGEDLDLSWLDLSCWVGLQLCTRGIHIPGCNISSTSRLWDRTPIDKVPGMIASLSATISPLQCGPHLSSDRHLNLDTGLNVDDDLLHHFGRRIQIDQSLMNPHLEHVPCLTALTTRRLSCRDLQCLCRKSDRALDSKVLGLGALEEFGADLLKGLDFARCESNADLVHFLRGVSEVAQREQTLGLLGRRRSLSRVSGKT